MKKIQVILRTLYGIVVEKYKNSTIINNNNRYSNEIIEEILKSLTRYNIGILEHNFLIENSEKSNSNIYNLIKNFYNFGTGYTTNHLNFL